MGVNIVEREGVSVAHPSKFRTGEAHVPESA
jgi:hypothetical protein